MKLYNTLNRKKETFEPIEPGKVSMYVCGPTVYNYMHIGNARPFIMFDVVRRYFEYKGYDVNYVQNYTDVDDKIINRSIEEGITAQEVAEKYIREVETDARGLGVHVATVHPKATEEMPEIIDMIETLMEKGYAYENEGTVFFDTSKFEGYGKLSKKNIEELEAGARIAVDDVKRHPSDFVLWKPKKEGEVFWESPWSEGRPGWHIECSAMSRKYLGETIDIHAGGADLVFPHHENEIAQSEAANGKTFVKYWLHNGFINVDNRKMSKSEGNFFTVREISEEYPYEVIRFFMLNAHYRSPLNFSRELMDAAQSGLERIRNGVENLKHLLTLELTEDVRASEEENLALLPQYKQKFEEAMDDDFNTADAVAVIFEMIRMSNSTATAESSKAYVEAVLDGISGLSDVLGISIEKEAVILDNDIEALIEERQTARKNRDFGRADEIRDELKEKGIILEDTREGVKYHRM